MKNAWAQRAGLASVMTAAVLAGALVGPATASGDTETTEPVTTTTVSPTPVDTSIPAATSTEVPATTDAPTQTTATESPEPTTPVQTSAAAGTATLNIESWDQDAGTLVPNAIVNVSDMNGYAVQVVAPTGVQLPVRAEGTEYVVDVYQAPSGYRVAHEGSVVTLKPGEGTDASVTFTRVSTKAPNHRPTSDPAAPGSRVVSRDVTHRVLISSIPAGSVTRR
ncbi:hypothetical protein [Williamsia sterculiae]|nr:hypothetical protein [Williamsia sterculiae]